VNDLELQDLMASDVKIVDSSLRTTYSGHPALMFPAEYMPDGIPYIAQVPEKLDPAVLRGWCNSVRGEWNARQGRKEAEAARAAELRQQSADGQDAPADKLGAGGSSTAQGGEAGEEGLEKYLEAEVARWTRAVKDAEGALLEAEESLARRARERDTALTTLRRAMKMLDFYRKEEQTETDIETLET
jgi:hypothetical protein